MCSSDLFDSPTKIKNDFRAEHYESDNITFIKSEIGYNKSYILVWLYNLNIILILFLL